MRSVLMRGVLRLLLLLLLCIFLLFGEKTETDVGKPNSISPFNTIEEDVVPEFLSVSGDVSSADMPSALETEITKGDTPVPAGPFVSIVIDDFGFSRKMAEDFAALKLPLTWAIIPFEIFSTFCAEKAKETDIPYLIHMPMGAKGDPKWKKKKPGNVVDSGMTPKDIAFVLSRAVESLPDAVGLNNHRGSRATADDSLMESFMEILSGFPLFFLDSRTISSSVAYRKAVEKGIVSIYSSIFLDHQTTEKYMEEQFRRGIAMAKRRGWVVMIAHTRSATLDFLRKIENSAEDEADFVTLPELLHILGIR